MGSVGRRAVLAHLGWEAVLLLLAAGMFTLVADADTVAQCANIAIVGFLASGFALSLRTGTPNLAVGAIAAAAGVGFVVLVGSDVPGPVAALLVVAAAAVVGLLLALVVGRTRLPAWAVTLAALGVLQALSLLAADGAVVPLFADPADETWFPVLACLFVVGSLLGAVWWWRVRDRLSGLRGALLGLGGSTLAAAVAGLVTANYLGAAPPGELRGTMIAIAAAVLGGASVLGRRAGFAGTVAAVLIVVFADRALASVGYGTELAWGVPLAIGLAVGLLLDRAHRVREVGAG